MSAFDLFMARPHSLSVIRTFACEINFGNVIRFGILPLYGEMKYWCEENLKGQYFIYGKIQTFDLAEDRDNFEFYAKLTWI